MICKAVGFNFQSQRFSPINDTQRRVLLLSDQTWDHGFVESSATSECSVNSVSANIYTNPHSCQPYVFHLFSEYSPSAMNACADL